MLKKIHFLTYFHLNYEKNVSRSITLYNFYLFRHKYIMKNIQNIKKTLHYKIINL